MKQEMSYIYSGIAPYFITDDILNSKVIYWAVDEKIEFNRENFTLYTKVDLF